MTVVTVTYPVLPLRLVKKKCRGIIKNGLTCSISRALDKTVLTITADNTGLIDNFLNNQPDILKFFSVLSADYNTPADLACEQLADKNIKIVTVESCTGGLIGKMLTDKPGSSKWYWGGFITYDNEAKNKLGVGQSIIKRSGAVSKETAEKMAEKGLERSTAVISVAVTGIAGPEGGTFEKPSGTVWISVKNSLSNNSATSRFLFSGSRAVVRKKAAQTALLFVYRQLLNRAGVDSNIFEDYI